MVKYLVDVLVFSLLLITSCNTQTERESLNIPTLNLTNELIEGEVIKFMKEVDSPGGQESNYYPYLTIKYLEADTVIYQIGYFGNPNFLFVEPIGFFVEINNDYIPVVIQGLMHSSEFFFCLHDEEIMEYCKHYFPAEYRYYQKNQEWPVPSIGHSLSWALFFKGDKLIEKEDSLGILY